MHYYCPLFLRNLSLSEMIWMCGFGHCSAMEQLKKKKPCIGKADNPTDSINEPWYCFTIVFIMKIYWKFLRAKIQMRTFEAKLVFQMHIGAFNFTKGWKLTYRYIFLIIENKVSWESVKKNPPRSQTYIVLLRMALFLPNKSCLATYLQSK